MVSTFKIVYKEGFSDTIISDHVRFWRRTAKVEVLCRVVKPSVLSYTGLIECYVPIRKNIEFLEELLDG